MPKSNAQRQAAYRARRNSERISESALVWMLYCAYHAGREDCQDGRTGVPLSEVYSRVVDRQLDVEFASH